MTAPLPAQGREADPGNVALRPLTVSARPESSASLSPNNQVGAPSGYKALEAGLLEILRTLPLAGAAIALQLGDYLECVASCGESTPPTGTRCYPGEGLTGTCFLTGEMIVCNDTEADSRVVREACQHLGVRSVLVIPLWRDSLRAGVLEVLSSEAGTFSEASINSVKRVAAGIELPTASQHASVSLPKVRPTNSFELQELLEAAYIIQQRHRALETLKDDRPDHTPKIELHDADSFPQGEPCVASADELTVLLSPNSYTLRKQFPKEQHYGRFVIGAAFLVLVFGSYYLIRQQGISSSAGKTKSADIAPGSKQSHLSSHSNPLDRAGEVELSRVLSVESNSDVQRVNGADAVQSYVGAMRAYEQEANRGNPDAAWKLGVWYLSGLGVAKDTGQAAKWLKKAANLGDIRAQSTLSQLYFEGVGVPRDSVRAYTWASIASSEWGDRDERLKIIRERMSAAQLQEANRRAAAWFAQKRIANDQDHR
jgi:hypothetical protein